MKLSYQILIYIIIVLCPATLIAQQQDNILFENFSAENGLSATSVSQSLKDNKGFLWVATNNGLNRFDGLNFQVFKHDKNEPNSLTENNIRVIFQDSKGYIWVGTLKKGLNRYDYKTGRFQAFLHDENSPNSISSNDILSIYEDKKGQLWIGTEYGLNLFNYEDESFTTFLPDKDNPNALSARAVLSIHEDHRGWLWVGTWDGGLNLMIPATNKKSYQFRHFRIKENEAFQLPSNHIWKILSDQKGRIWLGTFNGGLALMLPNDNKNPETFQPKFIAYNTNSFPNQRNRVIGDIVFALEEDTNGMIWVGSTFGISILDPNKYFDNFSSLQLSNNDPIPKIEFSHLTHSITSAQTLPSDDIKDIYIDERGIIWVSTTGGLAKYDPNNIRFTHYLKATSVEDRMYVTSFQEDDNDQVWVSTNTGHGLIKYNLSKQSYTFFQHNPNNANSLLNNDITTLLKVAEDTLWIATRKGLQLFNPLNNRFTEIIIKDAGGQVVNIDNAEAIFKDRRGKYWLCTDAGLILFNPENQRAIVFDEKEGNDIILPNKDVNDILEDDKGNLWITSYGGLYRITFKHNRYQLKVYSNDINDPKSICSNRALVLCKMKGQLWIGTEDGLSKYNPQTDDFKNITSKDGIKNPSILGVLPDNKNHLWVSSRQGLFSLDVETMQIRYFNKEDGLQSNTFSHYCAHKGDSKRLYFGGINGFNAFYGEKVNLNRTPPSVFITDIKVFNKSRYFDQDITTLQKIKLPHKDNYFSIHFSALNFTQSNENQYAYKLEGFDKDWIYSGQRNFASYTNLDGGTYTFKVKAANNDGFWNETGSSLKIVIIAPLWKRSWFRALVGLFILGFGYFIYWWRITTEKRKKTLLEKEVKARTQEIENLAQQLKEQNLNLEEKVHERTKAIEKTVVELKRSNQDLEQFAYAASHDLQEPLRMVGNFVQLLKRRYAAQLDKSGQEYIEYTVEGVKRMSSLILALLDFSRVGRLDVAFTQVNLDDVVKEKIADLALLIREKNAVIEISNLPTKMYCEPTQLGVVFYNLISNGLKFNEAKQPKIIIQLLEENPTHYIFSIKDNGIGIDEKYKDKIFEVFKRLHNRGEYKGTGIGLASCRRIIMRHNGEIWFESEVGKGTTFYFSVSKTLQED